MEPVTATAPASIGNFSVGFDRLGVAVEAISGPPLGDRITLSAGPGVSHEFEVSGPYAKWLPEDREDNIVWRCLEYFYEEIEQPVHVRLEKNLPVSSGLGSSASSIVAAATAFNAISESPLDQQDLLQLCATLEAEISGGEHLDNIAPCLLGGALLGDEHDSYTLTPLDLPPDWLLVLAYSGQEVSTRSMREILPDVFPAEVLAKQAAELDRFVTALADGDAESAAASIKDHLAEPLRAPLLEGFGEAKSHCLEHGALAVGISGSGPTLFALCNDETIANSLCGWLEQNYSVADHALARICRVQTAGATLNGAD
jgi:homoserine kinase